MRANSAGVQFMATTKTKRSKTSARKKKSHRLKTGKALEAVKPLSKGATPTPIPTETVSIPYGSIKFEYK